MGGCFFWTWKGVERPARARRGQRTVRWGAKGAPPVAESSDLSEWPRSVCNAAALSARRTQGTATGCYNHFRHRRKCKSTPVSALIWTIFHRLFGPSRTKNYGMLAPGKHKNLSFAARSTTVPTIILPYGKNANRLPYPVYSLQLDFPRANRYNSVR